MKYFRLAEFDSPDSPGSGSRMDLEFLEMLDRARGYAAIAFHITSGYRTTRHNELVGGVAHSSHTKGHAADIVATSTRDRYRILVALSRAGFTRIGINAARSFIHVDNDPDKPDAIWFYGDKEHLT